MCDKVLVEEATEVADVRSCQKLSLCPTELMPAGSNMGTPLTMVASGNTSGVTQLQSSREVRRTERTSSTVAKGSKEVGEEVLKAGQQSSLCRLWCRPR